MEADRVAILDMGTNTFNMLVATKSTNGIKVLYDSKLPVKIGKGGIHENLLLPDAIDRALNAIEKHNEDIKAFAVEKKLAFGTSALRGAINSNQVINPLKNKYGFKVELIDGNQEAEYIFYGIRESVSLDENPVLVLDIGGGSNEFIIGNNHQIFWKRSFDLGIARLLEIFQPSDPLTEKELNKLNQFITSELEPLFQAVKKYNPHKLIGASGTFDTLISMLSVDYPSLISKEKNSQPIPIDLFNKLYQSLIFSTFSDRTKMAGLDNMRIEMIVLATYFVHRVLKGTNIQTLWHSAFSLKEGAAACFFKK